jgi:hypothetical protein
MVKVSKRMKAMVAKVPAGKVLPLDQAVAVLKQFNTTKFDQTVEIAIRLGIDAKQADQLVRGSLVMPHGIGRSQATKSTRRRRRAPMKWAGRSWPRRSRAAGPSSTCASPRPT